MEAGKRLLRWGVGYGFSPAGVLDPVRVATDPTDRLGINEGMPMARVDLFRRESSLTVAAAAPRFFRHGGGAVPTRIVAARLRTVLPGGVEVAMIASAAPDAGPSWGGTITHVVGQRLEWHAEVIEQDAKAARAISAVAGVQYTFLAGVNVVLEYHRNGRGLDGAEWNATLRGSRDPGPMPGRQQFLFMRAALPGGDAAFEPELIVIAGLDDGSRTRNERGERREDRVQLRACDRLIGDRRSIAGLGAVVDVADGWRDGALLTLMPSLPRTDAFGFEVLLPTRRNAGAVILRTLIIDQLIALPVALVLTSVGGNFGGCWSSPPYSQAAACSAAHIADDDRLAGRPVGLDRAGRSWLAFACGVAGAETARRLCAVICGPQFNAGPPYVSWAIGATIALLVGGVMMTVRQLRTRLVSTELEALQARINPHFLFNTLNSIAALIREDPARAEAMTLQLSALFRTRCRPRGPGSSRSVRSWSSSRVTWRSSRSGSARLTSAIDGCGAARSADSRADRPAARGECDQAWRSPYSCASRWIAACAAGEREISCT